MHIWTARRVSGCSEIRSIHWSIIYKGGGDLIMYGHGFISRSHSLSLALSRSLSLALSLALSRSLSRSLSLSLSLSRSLLLSRSFALSLSLSLSLALSLALALAPQKIVILLSSGLGRILLYLKLCCNLTSTFYSISSQYVHE